MIVFKNLIIINIDFFKKGETVDRIETAVALSSNEVSRAQNELQEAETTKKKWQRKKYFIYVLVASVMVTLVGILVFKLT